MQTLRTIAFAVPHESTLVLVHGREAPSDRDWDHWVAQIRGTRKLNRNMGALIVTSYGSTPNAGQRKLVNDALGPEPNIVAVMSDHRATRAAITAFSWFNSGLKSFHSGDYEGVAHHLRLGPEWAERLLSTVATLERELSEGILSTSPSAD